MTRPESRQERGRPVVALIAVGWVALGFWAIEDGAMWRGAAEVLLGALMGSTYLWPESRLARVLDKPAFSRRKQPEHVDPPGPT